MTTKTDPDHNDTGVPAVITGPLAVFGTNPWSGIDDGLEGFTDDVGVAVPRLKFDPRPGGGFIDDLTGEKSETLEFIWLASFQTRAYWPDPFGTGDKEPACRATTPLPGQPWKPDDGVKSKQAPLCSECPHAEWTTEPPECHMRVNVLAFDTERNQFCRTSFGGTAIKHVRRYISGLKASAPPRPPLSVVTGVSLVEAEGNGMRWLEPSFSVSSTLTPAEVQPLLALRDSLRSQWQQLAQEDETGEHTPPAPTDVIDGEPFDEEGSGGEIF